MNYNDVDKKIGVLDTSITSLNVGDYIIMDSALKRIQSLFPKAQKVTFPTHERITRVGFKRQREISINFLCGTNCLGSSMFLRRQWNIGFLNSILMKSVITLGVGWQNYQKKPDLYTRLLLQRMLEKEALHSVRDNYTLEMLHSAGIKNVINTSCPTMWDLTEEHCNKIPKEKKNNVIFTLTDYRKDHRKDSNLINALKKTYEKVFFWVQGSQDYKYFLSLGDLGNNISIIPPNLSDFDFALKNIDSIEYVGTRLHAGIRALQNNVRSVIISVDNRAEEKKKDFNLKVIPRDLTISEYISEFNKSFETKIKIPLDKINLWKNQFETK